MSVWRPATGTWYSLSTKSPGTYSANQWGIQDDVVVPGDYDGDGKTDIAVWLPYTGIWYVLPSKTSGTYNAVQWGQNGDISLSVVTRIITVFCYLEEVHAGQ